MTRIWDERFEGAGYEETWSDGESVGATSTLDEDFATSSVTGAPADWQSQCLRVVKATGESVFVRHDLASAETTLYLRVEIIFKSFPDDLSQFSGSNFVQIQDSGSTTCFAFRVQELGTVNNGPYRLQFIENASGTLTSHNSTDNIALDTRYRLEAKYDIAGNAWEWRINGVTEDSGTFSGGPTEVQNNLALGPQGTGGGVVEFFLDNVGLDDADWLGAEGIDSTVEAEALAGALPQVVVQKNPLGLAVKSGGLTTLARKANLSFAAVAGGGGPTIDTGGPAPDASVDSFLLLEDGASYLLLEDDASKIIVRDGIDALTREAVAAALADVQIKIGKNLKPVVGGVVADIVVPATAFLSFAVTAGALADHRLKANLFNVRPGVRILDTVETVNAAGISHSVSLPDGSNVAGRRLLLFASVEGLATFSYPGGWTRLEPDPFDEQPNEISLGIAYHDTDGSEGYPATGATINVVLDSAKPAVFQVRQIADFVGAPDLSRWNTSTSTFIDFDTLTPASSVQGHLFSIVVAHDTPAAAVTAYPDGYADEVETAGDTALVSAETYQLGTPHEAGQLTVSASVSWIAAVLANRGNQTLASAGTVPVGGLARSVRKLSFSAQALAAGLVQAVVTTFGAAVHFVQATAVAAGIPARTLLIKVSGIVAKAGGLAQAGVQFLGQLSIFSGGMGLGSVSRPGGGWHSWKKKSRKR